MRRFEEVTMTDSEKNLVRSIVEAFTAIREKPNPISVEDMNRLFVLLVEFMHLCSFDIMKCEGEYAQLQLIPSLVAMKMACFVQAGGKIEFTYPDPRGRN